MFLLINLPTAQGIKAQGINAIYPLPSRHLLKVAFSTTCSPVVDVVDNQYIAISASWTLSTPVPGDAVLLDFGVSEPWQISLISIDLTSF
jgi:hypothetical protein